MVDNKGPAKAGSFLCSVTYTMYYTPYEGRWEHSNVDLTRVSSLYI